MSTVKTLKLPNETFTRIVAGKRWIGRIWKNVDGTFSAKIGEHLVLNESTHNSAFNEIAARHFGFKSYDDFHHAKVKAQRVNKQTKQHAKFVVNEMFAGNYEPLFQMLDGLTNTTK